MSSVQKHPQLFPMFLANFIGTLGFSIVLPFLVFVVMKFGGDAIVYGLLAATYPLFQLIGAPILGRWSDTYGRKKVLLLSNAGTSIGWVIFLFALFLPAEKVLALTYLYLELLSSFFQYLYYSFPGPLMELLAAIFLLLMRMFRTYQQMKPGVRTLEKWQYLPTLGLL